MAEYSSGIDSLRGLRFTGYDEVRAMPSAGPMDLDQAIRDIQTCVRHMEQFAQNAGDMTHERMVTIHAILHALGQDLFKRQCQLN